MGLLKKIKALIPKKVITAGKSLLAKATPYIAKQIGALAGSAIPIPGVAEYVGKVTTKLLGKASSLPSKPKTAQAAASPTAITVKGGSAEDLALAEIASRTGTMVPSFPQEAGQAAVIQRQLAPVLATNRSSILASLSQAARVTSQNAMSIETQAEVLRLELRRVWDLLNAIVGNDEPVPAGWVRANADFDGEVAGSFVSPAGVEITVRQKRGESPEAAMRRVKTRHGVG